MENGREYYVLTAQNGNPIPRVVNWYGKLDVRKLNRKDYRELPAHILLDMETGRDVVYPDILTDPILLVSREMMQVIKRYDDDIPFLFAALFDTVREESVVYFCPILPEGEEAEERGAAIYRLRTVRGSELRIRLDLAESLLCRGAVGIGLTVLNDRNTISIGNEK